MKSQKILDEKWTSAQLNIILFGRGAIKRYKYSTHAPT
jgi:hypothetical protein